MNHAAAVPITADAAVTTTERLTVFHNSVAVSCRNSSSEIWAHPT